MMPFIDTTYAWRLLRDARAAGPETPWRPCAGLIFHPNGRWEAAQAVETAAAQLLDTLLPIALAPPALVVAQLGQSLDGRIATVSGHSHYVTGAPSRVHLHRLRSLVDAVVVGVGTVAADDPQLTVRHVAGVDPVRVVIDPHARAPATARVFAADGPRTLQVVTDAALAAPGAEPLVLAPGPLPQRLLAALAARGLRRVLIEGGGVTVSRFIDADCVDRLHTVVAPLLIGSGRPALALAEIERLDQARRPACRSYALGEDRLYDLDLRATGAPNTST